MTKAVALNQALRLHEALRGGGEQEYVRTWVRRFTAQIAAGERAPEVKLHPLGFLCFPAFRFSDLGGCVHAWLPDGPRAVNPTSDMHMHSFDMMSRVLAGTVLNQELDLDFDAPPSHQIYTIAKGGHEDVDVLSPTGQVTAPKPRPLHKYGAGEQYAIARGCYHSADNTLNDEYTVTFMVAENWNADPQRTLVPLERADVCVEYHRVVLGEAEARKYARVVHDLMD